MHTLSSQTNTNATIRLAGFTLVELLTVMAVAAVFASLAVPNFAGSIIRSDLRDSETRLSETLRNAKSIARSQNSNVTVTVTANSGDITVVSADGSTSFTVSLPDDVTAGTTAAFVFTPLGTVNASGNIQLTSARESSLYKTISIVNTMGQITSSSSY